MDITRMMVLTTHTKSGIVDAGFAYPQNFSVAWAYRELPCEGSQETMK